MCMHEEKMCMQNVVWGGRAEDEVERNWEYHGGKQETEGERVTRRNRLEHGLISPHRKKKPLPALSTQFSLTSPLSSFSCTHICSFIVPRR